MKIGAVMMLAENPVLGRAPSYREVREMAQMAEEGGLDSIWLYDHLLYRSDGHTIGIWECWTMLSALAEATRQVELGSLVLCNSFRNPAIVAKMAETLDEVSGGRFILGIGAGWNQPEYEAFGIPFDHRVDRFEEALQIIRPLLKTGHTNFTGKYYQVRDCMITPRGPHAEGPPLMVGASGERMMRLAAQYADLWNYGYLGAPDTLAAPKARIEAACQSAGRDLATLDLTAMVALVFPELIGSRPIRFDHYLTGTRQEVAEAMLGYQRLGVSHLMFHLAPYTPETLQHLIDAAHEYHQISG